MNLSSCTHCRLCMSIILASMRNWEALTHTDHRGERSRSRAHARIFNQKIFARQINPRRTSAKVRIYVLAANLAGNKRTYVFTRKPDRLLRKASADWDKDKSFSLFCCSRDKKGASCLVWAKLVWPWIGTTYVRKLWVGTKNEEGRGISQSALHYRTTFISPNQWETVYTLKRGQLIKVDVSTNYYFADAALVASGHLCSTIECVYVIAANCLTGPPIRFHVNTAAETPIHSISRQEKAFPLIRNRYWGTLIVIKCHAPACRGL